MATLAAPERRSAADVQGKPLSAATILEGWMGTPSASGVRVTESTALAIADVYKCVNVLSQSVAMLPLHLNKRLEGGGKERATSHPLYPILHDEPNPWMTSYTLRETLMGHRALWGNAFAEIMRDDNGRVFGLFPLRPDRMARPILSESGLLLYPYQLPNGEIRPLPQASVLHLRGLSQDGLWGLSVIREAARDSAGLAKAAEVFGAKMFSNGARAGGVLEVQGALSPEAAERLKASWNSAHQGLDNAHRIAVLEEGVTWKQIGIPPGEAQWIELRKFQRSDIAGLFRVPPHLIGDLERATFSNIEQQEQEFVTHTLMPWLTSWEQEIHRSLLTRAERQTYFASFLVLGLLRGDSAARGQFYQTQFNLGAISPNEIREAEDRNPIEGGDEHFVQMNLVPLSRVDEFLDRQTADQQQPDEPEPDQPTAQDRGEEFDLKVGRILLNIQRFEELGEIVLAEMLRRQLREMYGVDPNTEPEPPEEEEPTEDDESEEEGDESDQARSIEHRSLNARLSLRRVYHPLLKDTAERVVRREVAAIREHGLPRLAQRDLAGFSAWLEQHNREELVPSIVRAFGPVVRAYGAAVEREVLEELDVPALTELLDPFLERYVEALATNYAERSRGQLRDVARKAQAEGVPLEDAIQQRLTEWLERRAGKIADTESVRAESAVAHQTYRRAGVQQLKWQTRGRNCPYCARLQGKTVGVAEAFANEGDELDGNEGEPRLRIKRRTQHPPAHGACNCGLVRA